MKTAVLLAFIATAAAANLRVDPVDLAGDKGKNAAFAGKNVSDVSNKVNIRTKATPLWMKATWQKKQALAMLPVAIQLPGVRGIADARHDRGALTATRTDKESCRSGATRFGGGKPPRGKHPRRRQLRSRVAIGRALPEHRPSLLLVSARVA